MVNLSLIHLSCVENSKEDYKRKYKEFREQAKDLKILFAMWQSLLEMNEDLKKEKYEFLKINDNLNKEKDKLLEINENLKKEKYEFLKINDYLKEEKDKLLFDQKNIVKYMQEKYEKELKLTEEEIENLTKKNSKYEKKINDLQEQVGDFGILKKKIARMKVRNEEKDDKILNLKEKIKKLKQEIKHESKNEISDLEDQIQYLKVKIKEQKNEIKDLEKDNEKMEKELTEINAKNKYLKEKNIEKRFNILADDLHSLLGMPEECMIHELEKGIRQFRFAFHPDKYNLAKLKKGPCDEINRDICQLLSKKIGQIENLKENLKKNDNKQ